MKNQENAIKELKVLLKKHSIPYLRKALGQKFLIDFSILERQIILADITSKDNVLEIGAGLGTLTRKLAEKAGKVYAFEADKKLASALEKEVSVFPNVEVIPEDAVKSPFPPFNKCISNLPYNISTPIMFKLLKHDFEQIVLMLQKEFAEKLASKSGSKDYSRLTVLTSLKTKIEITQFVPKTAFYPVPKVDSVLVVIKPVKPPFEKDLEEQLEDLLKVLFSRKSRKVRKVLRSFLNKKIQDKAFTKKIVSKLPYTEERIKFLQPIQFVNITKILIQLLEEVGIGWENVFSGTKT